jgi:hypothetical protein
MWTTMHQKQSAWELCELRPVVVIECRHSFFTVHACILRLFTVCLYSKIVYVNQLLCLMGVGGGMGGVWWKEGVEKCRFSLVNPPVGGGGQEGEGPDALSACRLASLTSSAECSPPNSEGHWDSRVEKCTFSQRQTSRLSSTTDALSWEQTHSLSHRCTIMKKGALFFIQKHYHENSTVFHKDAISWKQKHCPS